MEGENPVMSKGSASSLHIWVIPYPAGGHIFPMVDLTHQLLLRGLKVTIVITPKNLCYLNHLLSLHSSTNNVQILELPFLSHSNSLPPGVENMQHVPISFGPHMTDALSQLYHPLLNWFRTHPSPPTAILSDLLLSSWTTKLAAHVGIPNICFSPLNPTAVCSWLGRMNRMSSFFSTEFTASIGSWGLVFNSFEELEGDKFVILKERFTHHGRIWGVGPLLPVNHADGSLHERGGPSSIPQDRIMAWLDSCQPDNSVVYVGFGSQITLTKHQMKAVASALEESRVRFIWAVKDPMKGAEDGDDDQSLIPDGFEDRMAGRGLVIKGWAPQVAILRHRAVGSYLTHCGWNSALEGIVAGVLLLAWPMQADHFHITNLLADEYKAATRVCIGLRAIPDSSKLARIFIDSTTMTLPERARAIELQKAALKAISKGGSSYQAFDKLIQELSTLDYSKINKKPIKSSM